VLPAGVSAVVTVAGTAPNFTYTITFFGLGSNPGTMTIANNTLSGGTPLVAAATTIDFGTEVQTVTVAGTPTAFSITYELTIRGQYHAIDPDRSISASQ